MEIACFLLPYHEPYLSPHHCLLGPARMVPLSAETQPYLVGQKSFRRLKEHRQQERKTAGKVKIKRSIKAGIRVIAWLRERPAWAGETSSGVEQKEKKTQGITVGAWLSGTVWDESLSLLVLCDGHCCSCVVFPNVCPARFLTLSLLLIQLKTPWLHLGGNG